MRYHVFDPESFSGIERQARASALDFVRTAFDVLNARFPDSVAPRLPTDGTAADAVELLKQDLERLALNGQKFVIIDGIDHVVRTGGRRTSLFDALPRQAPTGVVFLLFGQPDWEYPLWLDRHRGP